MAALAASEFEVLEAEGTECELEGVPSGGALETGAAALLEWDKEPVASSIVNEAYQVNVFIAASGKQIIKVDIFQIGMYSIQFLLVETLRFEEIFEITHYYADQNEYI